MRIRFDAACIPSFNALVHNNYARGVPIQISVYADKIYIGNDVSYLENWTPEKLLGKHKSIQTNPAIANVFFRCGFIEAWGRGIEKICRECDKSGNSYPVFDISDCGFMVRFDALKSALIDNVAQGVAQGVAQELTDMQKQILELIRNNPRISRSEIAENIGKSVKTIERRLGEMENFVKFIGSGYSGHWEIVSSADDKK